MNAEQGTGNRRPCRPIACPLPPVSCDLASADGFASIGNRTLSALAFYIFAAVTLGGAVGTAVCREIVRAAVCLMVALCGVAGLYWNLAADVAAAVQVLVYVGGVTVLLLFGVMLTQRGPGVDPSEPKRRIAVASVPPAVVAVLLIAAVTAVDWDAVKARSVEAREPGRGWGLTGKGDDIRPKTAEEARRNNPPAEQRMENVRDLGWALLTDSQFLLPFYLTGVHIAVVLVGAAWLLRRRADGPTDPSAAGDGARDTHPGATQDKSGSGVRTGTASGGGASS